jgi:hypothetical protein
MSSSLPSIITIHQWVQGFFFDGELINYGFNQSLGVDDSICIFTRCDSQTNHGDVLVECINQHSLMNHSLVTTSIDGYLNCSTITFLFLS